MRRLETRGKTENAFGPVVLTRNTQVAKYIQKESFFFPSDFVTTWSELRKDGTTHLDDEMHVSLLSVDPGAQHDPSVFEITFPKGTRVVDLDTRLESIVGVPGSTKPRPPIQTRFSDRKRERWVFGEYLAFAGAVQDCWARCSFSGEGGTKSSRGGSTLRDNGPAAIGRLQDSASNR